MKRTKLDGTPFVNDGSPVKAYWGIANGTLVNHHSLLCAISEESVPDEEGMCPEPRRVRGWQSNLWRTEEEGGGRGTGRGGQILCIAGQSTAFVHARRPNRDSFGRKMSESLAGASRQGLPKLGQHPLPRITQTLLRMHLANFRQKQNIHSSIFAPTLAH